MTDPSNQFPFTTREQRRLDALDSYKILDTAPEAAFDDIVTIASEICDVPMALISLVDSKRQWFKAAVGLEVSETPREVAFCAHAIQQESTFIVSDAAADERFSANPLVTGNPNLRFYAGTPLQTPDGEALGTLCVLDTRPRNLTPHQDSALQALGRLVMQQLEFRKSLFKQRENEQRNQLVLDTAIDYAIITLDLTGRVTSWNEGARQIFGWNSDEMCGQPCTVFFTPEDRGAQMEFIELQRALSRGREANERWHIRKDGSRFFASGEVMTLRAANGQPMGFLKMLRDRTTQRLASVTEPALLKLSDRLRDLTDVAEMSFVAAELIGRTLNVSRAGYGTVTEDVDRVVVDRDWTQKDIASIAGNHVLSDFGEYIADLMSGAVVTITNAESDARVIKTSLTRLSILAQINVPVVEHGRTVAIFFAHCSVPRDWEPAEVEFIRDVAERTRLAVQRRQAEQQVRQLAQSLRDQVEDRTRERDRLWLLSRDPFLIADSGGVWQRVNPAWTQLLGWSEHELLGRTAEWIEHPEDLAKTRTELAKLASGAVTAAFENRLRAKDGLYHWFSWTATREEGLLYCVARDVSEDKANALVMQESAEQLRQSQKMEAVGQLTGGLAHDFNNLLTGVTGSLEMLHTRVRQGRISEIDRYVLAAQGAAKRAAALTHRLLAFSRRQTLDPKPTDLNRLVAGMSELIQRTIGPEIALESVAAVGLWNTLIDPGQLENALLNLCINARDAMPKGGKLTIETGNKWLDERAARERDLTPGQYATLCVSDTGTGMSADVVARAFDPFFTTKPIGMGTGLGLSMVYGFARQSGGQVRIYSEVSQGTLVCLYLPRHAGLGETHVETAASTNDGTASLTETVLVVDDEPTVRMLVADILQDLGCTVLEAQDGASGLKEINSGVRIDLLITDVGLPGGINGRQLADAARVARPSLKILFITGYAENAVLSHGHLDSGMHVLTKPFTMDDLARRIRELIAEPGA